ncbi:hypothetical protein L2E82_51057 [Cichorium intybus]|nr:hypothetical protein L2E82_51057 [Cichorium intybus]
MVNRDMDGNLVVTLSRSAGCFVVLEYTIAKLSLLTRTLHPIQGVEGVRVVDMQVKPHGHVSLHWLKDLQEKVKIWDEIALFLFTVFMACDYNVDSRSKEGQLEAANIETKSYRDPQGWYRLTKHELSDIQHGKVCERFHGVAYFASRIPQALDGVILVDFPNFVTMCKTNLEYVRNLHLTAKNCKVLIVGCLVRVKSPKIHPHLLSFSLSNLLSSGGYRFRDLVATYSRDNMPHLSQSCVKIHKPSYMLFSIGFISSICMIIQEIRTCYSLGSYCGHC